MENYASQIRLSRNRLRMLNRKVIYRTCNIDAEMTVIMIMMMMMVILLL